jgi:hypothetical protein
VHANYAAILVRNDIDVWKHADVFAKELKDAFQKKNLETKIINYMESSKQAHNALQDKQCLFAVCFNGFGSEIKIPASAHRLLSAYEIYNKDLIDLMHDCPGHETMSHQLNSTFPRRYLFSTDYGYAAVANSLDMPNVRFMPSITFPQHVTNEIKHSDRSIEILLPIGISPPEFSSSRHRGFNLKSRVYASIFEVTAWRCNHDFSLDPLITLTRDCADAGIPFDIKNEDSRFLYSTVADFVKFERRRRILKAISHLPITIIGDRPPDASISRGKLRFQTSRSFDHLLHLMADSRAVICPTPHMTGFHERVLGAMSAGSAVLSSPNHLLQSQFVDGKELLFFKDEASLVRVAEKVFSDPGTIERIADEGHKRSAALFSPERFVELTLSILGIDDSQLNRTHQAGNKNTTATEPARDADTVAVKSSA